MSIFLSNEVIVYLLLELILIALMCVAVYGVFQILKSWDFEASTPLQYALEKKNYLINTILYFTITCKIILFVYFVHTVDALSNIVPGAMCSAGVVGANVYGGPLLLLKLVLIFGFGLWIVVNRLDLTFINFPYIKKKYILFIFLFVGSLIEFGLEYAYFSNIPLSVPVFCCATVFQAPQLPFGYTKVILLAMFFLLLGAIVILNTLKQMMATFSVNVIFLFVAYYAITYYFGIYVYEMPNHQCPYCLLQRDRKSVV